MSDLFYSDEALNTLNLFYRADYIVYVEGPDDIPFWEYIFSATDNKRVEIQDVGGCKSLEIYIDKIKKNEINDVVACDSDFTLFDQPESHSHIIKTYGYSIENTFICPKTTTKLIKNLARLPLKRTPTEEVSTFFIESYSRIEKLVEYDIANHINKHGIKVINDSCDQFMQSKNVITISCDKIEHHLSKLPNILNEEVQTKINNIIQENNKEKSDFIRGHFLFSLAAKFISNLVRKYDSKQTISYDALYGSYISAFENILNEEHPHFDYYKSKITNIGASV